MNSDSTKGVVLAKIRQLINTLRKEYNAEYRTVLYTAAGRIVCDLDPPAPKSDLVGFVDDPTTFTLDISAEFDGMGLFDSQLVNVKNAVVLRNDSEEVLSRADQMVIFSDQIIGFRLKRL